VAGHYDWLGDHYAWTHGTWVQSPAPGETWVAPHWQPTAGGYTWVPGQWR
jgi:WXXGXW repeat (2 copies)